MIETLLALSWIAIIALSVIVYALARQIGVLHERIRPVGALSAGSALATGEIAPEFTVESLTGGTTQIGGERADGRSALLFFVSPACPVCKTLIPVVRAIAQQDADWLRVVFCSDGLESEHRALIQSFELRAFPYVLSRDVGLAYQVGKLPYGVLIGPNGRLAAHGLVNNREHIESLFEAQKASDDWEVQLASIAR